MSSVKELKNGQWYWVRIKSDHPNKKYEPMPLQWIEKVNAFQVPRIGLDAAHFIELDEAELLGPAIPPRHPDTTADEVIPMHGHPSVTYFCRVVNTLPKKLVCDYTEMEIIRRCAGVLELIGKRELFPEVQK
jgi:hypothetical protein